MVELYRPEGGVVVVDTMILKVSGCPMDTLNLHNHATAFFGNAMAIALSLITVYAIQSIYIKRILPTNILMSHVNLTRNDFIDSQKEENIHQGNSSLLSENPNYIVVCCTSSAKIYHGKKRKKKHFSLMNTEQQ